MVAMTANYIKYTDYLLKSCYITGGGDEKADMWQRIFTYLCMDCKGGAPPPQRGNGNNASTINY